MKLYRAVGIFRDPFRDRLGPGYYFDSEQLDRVRFVREVADVPIF